MNREVILKKLLDKSHLTKAQIFCIPKIIKVVIYKHENLIIADFSIIALNLISLNNNL